MLAVSARLRDHPHVLDGVLAVLLFSLSAGQWPIGPPLSTTVAVLVSGLLAATVLFRRRYPVAAFTAAMTIAAAQVLLGMQAGDGGPVVRALEPTVTDVVIPVLLYTVAAHRPRRVSVTALLVCLAATAVAITRWAPAQPPASSNLVFAAAAGLGGTALAAWVLGDSMAYRYRREYYASLEERTARAEAERDAQIRIAAAAQRASELQHRRALAIDESAARLRRIERDLHDGAQVRLAALAMTLGELKEALDAAPADSTDGDRTRMLVSAAHQNAKETLAELRDLARGIHPPVLDRGLGPALSSLTGTSPVPAGLDITSTQPPSPAIASIAYFCAAELLANVVKHSAASQATISVTDQADRLLMTVTDDGVGGAQLAPGGGLAGLLDRVQTVDGRLDVTSPPGGPTVVTIELPSHA
ncbi:MAG TPA: histidine kinase [Streptosporangiaceae bacterium]|nr:histidine kinase [Streptosporangiaceae bacterium]